MGRCNRRFLVDLRGINYFKKIILAIIQSEIKTGIRQSGGYEQAKPMIVTIVSDRIMNNKIRTCKFCEYIARGLTGIVFLIYSMPLVVITYIQFYVFSGISGYDLLPKFSETLVIILGAMIILGAIMGIITIRIAKKKSPFQLNQSHRFKIKINLISDLFHYAL